ncbi:MAG: mechanosensitive ion channel family protein [Flavobacteriales bacterium]|nr:mechanosensitive ion channel family protein [Flavobacteriales bacterium]
MNTALRNELYYGNTVEQWGVALGIALGSWLVGKTLYWLSRQVLRKVTQRTTSRLDDILLYALEGPVVVLITVLGFLVAYEQLNIPERPDQLIRNAFHAAVALSVTWVVVRIVDAALNEYLVPYAQQSDSRLDDHLVPVVRKGARGALWTIGVIVALNNAGYNVGALLAGLGIGGLALAMAAKDTVSNIFGGITVFADKPFRLGDRVRLGGYDGFVQEVGIRSTRIRTLEGPVVVVPNHQFTDSIVENVTEEPSRRVRHELGVLYETPAEKVEKALAILKAIVMDHQDVLEAEHLVSFNAFKEYSLNILFIYYIRKSADIFATQTCIHLEVLRRFRAADLHFAYPTALELQGEYKAPY